MVVEFDSISWRGVKWNVVSLGVVDCVDDEVDCVFDEVDCVVDEVSGGVDEVSGVVDWLINRAVSCGILVVVDFGVVDVDVIKRNAVDSDVLKWDAVDLRLSDVVVAVRNVEFSFVDQEFVEARVFVLYVVG